MLVAITANSAFSIISSMNFVVVTFLGSSAIASFEVLGEPYKVN